jgi:hypothetical protein
MRIAHIPNANVLPYFALDPVQHVFQAYICRERPDGSALAAFRDGELRGAVVSGKEAGLFAASTAWLVAHDEDVATELLRALPDTWRDGLEFPLRYGGIVSREIPNASISKDFHLSRSGAPELRPGDGALVAIEVGALERLDVPEDVAPWIGPLEGLPHGFYGLTVNGVLVALAESFVRYDRCASVQQVFTSARMRHKGYAASLISKLMQGESDAVSHWTWLAAASNTASIALASSLGFEKAYELGCVEMRDGSP